MRKLGAKHLFGFAHGNKHSQLLALFWNIVGRERNRNRISSYQEQPPAFA